MDRDQLRVITAAAAAIAVIIGAVGMIPRRNRRRTIWTREWIARREQGRGVLNMVEEELAVEDRNAYKNFLRMTEEQFQEILILVRDDIRKEETVMRASISPEKRLALTLRFLATGESFRSLMYSSRIHESTISKFVPEVCRSIYKHLRRQYVKDPRTPPEWEEISQKFETLWNFPMCLGAMDGKHIAIRPPTGAGSHFYNYKGWHSIVLFGVVGPDYKFIYVDVGVNGRVSDGGVYRESSLAHAIADNSLGFPPNKRLGDGQMEVPYVFLADEAFPLSTRIMKPYPFRGLTEEQRNFNYRLSRARMVVENAFGILSNRFRISLTPINLSPEKVESIMLASVALHNYLCSKNALYIGNCEEACPLPEMGEQLNIRAPNSALRVREEFKNFMRAHRND